jgi:sigma-E factor negative regulatory protein RseC
VVERFLGQRSTRVRALNPLDAQVGEGVLVGLQEGAILRGAVALYLVPLLALIGGAVVGGLLAAEIAPARADLLVGLAGGFGLLTGLGWARRFARRVHDDGRYQPVVLRRQE